MEEMITVDGRQFKLSTDRPLTAQEKVHTIAEIRKQTGCSTCGPKVAKMGNDWQYGGRIKSMAACADVSAKGSGPDDDPIGLEASPDEGVAPYTVRFYIKRNAEAYILMETGVGDPALGTVEGDNTQIVAADGETTTSFSYKLIDSDVVAATGHATADIPTTNTTGAVIDSATGSTAPLAAGNVRVAVTTVDSCVPAAEGPKFCIEWCDIAITCIPPTCNFVVT